MSLSPPSQKKKNKDNAWRPIVTNSEHNHEIATDPFAFREHHSRDPDRTDALDQGKGLRASSTQYGQAARILGIQGLRLSRSDYYNLAHSEGAQTPEEELLFALGSLKDRGFHVRCKEKYIVKNNVRERRVIEQIFFFCNAEQIRLARRFVGGFLFLVAYCYIT